MFQFTYLVPIIVSLFAMTRNKKNSPDKNLSNSTENQKTDREMIIYLVDKIDSFGQTLKDLKDIIHGQKAKIDTLEDGIN